MEKDSVNSQDGGVLFLAVIERAMRDIGGAINAEDAISAEAYFFDERGSLKIHCEMLGLEIEALQKRAAFNISQRDPKRLARIKKLGYVPHKKTELFMRKYCFTNDVSLECKA